jgi:molybdate transport system substrate-binding protein
MIRLISAIVVIACSAVAVPLHGQRTSGSPATLRIAAASDLKFALDEVLAAFKTRQGAIRIEPTYGSSGNFHAQLRQRAPFDLFLSADVDYARDLVKRGLGAESDLFTYAVGRLVVWVPSRSPLPIERDGFRALTGARRIAIANPRHAPYGRAAEAAMRGAGIWTQAEPRLVLAENVAQAAQFVQSGAADAGVISKSLSVAPAMRAGRAWDVPSTAHPEILQGGLVLRHAASREAALAVRAFLLGDDGRRILIDHGFGLPR